MPTSEDPTSAALWVVLARCYHSMAEFVEQSIASLDIGLSDFMILEALLHKGPLSMSALCDAALLANASMTSAIDRLEARQFVQRTASSEDRRVKHIQLTSDGAALVKRLYARHLRDLDEVMAGIPLAHRIETRQTLKSLGRAAQSLTASRKC